MKNFIINMLKVFTWIFWIAAVIAGFYLGGETAERYDEFNFFTALLIWICGGTGGCLLYSAALHLENQETIISNQERIYQKLNQDASNSVKTSVLTGSPIPHNSGNSWQCPKCGKTNPITQRICKDCGYNK